MRNIRPGRDIVGTDCRVFVSTNRCLRIRQEGGSTVNGVILGQRGRTLLRYCVF